MMLIGRSSRRENLLRVTGCRAHEIDQAPLANHIRASSRENRMAAPTGQTHDRTRPQSSPRQKVLDRTAPSTHDPVPQSLPQCTES